MAAGAEPDTAPRTAGGRSAIEGRFLRRISSTRLRTLAHLPTAVRYVIATVFVIAALLALFALPKGQSYPFILFLPIILGLAVLLDHHTSIYATFLSTALIDYFVFAHPAGGQDVRDLFWLAVFVATGLAIGFIVEAMRDALNKLDFDGTIVIGEGERDEAPMLFIGEKVGRAIGTGPRIDIALDPLEGTTITAKAGPNALAVLAISEEGGLLNAPDTYMDKIAIGPGFATGLIDLRKSVTDNIRALASAKGVEPSEIMACVLDRPRHEALVAELRKLGCGIMLIPDGDVAGIIATTNPDTGVDIYLGQGGAPEGVLAAAALRCVGGQMQARLVFRNDDERGRAHRLGITDLSRIYDLKDLARGDTIFAATGVTDGSLLQGVKRRRDGTVTTQSVVMRASSGTVRWVSGEHRKGPRG